MKTDTTEIQDGETRFNHIGKGANTAFHIIFILLSILCLAPLVFVIIISFSSEHSVMVNGYSFRPDEWSTGAYEFVFQSGGQVMHSLGMSALVTVTGVAIGMALTSTYAYVLSRKTFRYRKLFTGILVATMFFNGGLIPTFLVMKNLGLYNTRAIIILMGCVSVWNLMVARTYIQTNIPGELYEAAMLDGATHFQYFSKVVLPLSKTIIAVLAVYYGVAKWNDYFNGLVYLRDRSLLPLQTVLREILATLQVDKSGDYMMSMADSAASMSEAMRIANVSKYCIIVVATGPVVILYAVMQKYFEKGVMIGSLKG